MWKAWKVALRLKSPMHVGWRTLGNVKYTRPYITGRVLWGGLTARMARDNRKGNYEEIAELVHKHLAFSYLFLSKHADHVDLVPWGEKASEFEWEFLGSYASTALKSDGHSYEDGSLHETEFLANATRTDGLPTHALGVIFEKAGCELPWRKALDQLQIGGERSYGWGRVALTRDPVESDSLDWLFGKGAASDLRQTRPILWGMSEARAHVATGGALDACEGPIEPFIGRLTTSSDRQGREFSDVQLAWTPGSTVKTTTKFEIGQFGVWKLAE